MSDQNELAELVRRGVLTREQAAWCWDEGARRGASPMQPARELLGGGPSVLSPIPGPPASAPTPGPYPVSPAPPSSGLLRVPAPTPGGGPSSATWQAVTAATTPGSIIGPYTVLRKLGEGGMGLVLLVRSTDDPDADPLALKLLTKVSESGRARLRREVEAGVTVDRHPHVVRIRGADLDASPPWIAMDHVDGEALDERLARGPLPVDDSLSILLGVTDALAFLHRSGVLHRDIKPGNVLIRSEDGAPLLADFGLASLESAQTLTNTGESIGTPAYMAPEAFSGGATRDPRVDLWALGVMFYECLTGRRPFQGSSNVELMAQITSARPESPSRLRPELSTDHDAVVAKALAKDPAERYATAEELLEDLRGLARGGAISASHDQAPAATVRRAARRLGLAGALLIVLVLGALIAGGLIWQREQSRQAAIEALQARVKSEIATLRERVEGGRGRLPERFGHLVVELQRDRPSGDGPRPVDPAFATMRELIAGLEAAAKLEETREVAKRLQNNPKLKALSEQARLLQVLALFEAHQTPSESELGGLAPEDRALIAAIRGVGRSPEETLHALESGTFKGRHGEAPQLLRAIALRDLGRTAEAREILRRLAGGGVVSGVAASLNAEIQRRTVLGTLLDPKASRAQRKEALASYGRTARTAEDRGREAWRLINVALDQACRSAPIKGPVAEARKRTWQDCLVLLTDVTGLELPGLPVPLMKEIYVECSETSRYAEILVVDGLIRAVDAKFRGRRVNGFHTWRLGRVPYERKHGQLALARHCLLWSIRAARAGVAVNVHHSDDTELLRVKGELNPLCAERPDDLIRRIFRARAVTDRAVRQGDVAASDLALVRRDIREALERTDLLLPLQAEIRLASARLMRLDAGPSPGKAAIEKAMKELDIAERCFPFEPDQVHEERADWLIASKEHRKAAVKFYEEAVEWLSRRWSLTESHERDLIRKDHRRCWLQYEDHLQGSPRRSGIYTKLARLMIRDKVWSRAKTYAELGLHWMNGSTDAKAVLGHALLGLGRRDEARAIARKLGDAASPDLRRLREALGSGG